MEEDQKKYLNALNLVFPSPEGTVKILSYFSLPEEAFKIKESDLKNLGFKESTILNFLKKRQRINIEDEWKKLKRENVRILTKDEPRYPKLLKKISSPPVSLYIKGKLIENETYFSVVGTRYPSDYGKMVTKSLIFELTQEFTIVSGMARGIDSLAQRTALIAGKRTVAILGNGLDIIYPPENKKLAKEIEKNGALISEFPLGVGPKSYHFPLRNRIIAGISIGTLVIEAKKKSGALITAHFALEEGREVFGVPGPIFSKTSEGTNNLIKQGAYLVSEASDIFNQFNIKKEIKKEIKAGTKEENLILEALKDGPLSIDEIIEKTKIEPGKMSSLLILMEINGKIKRSGTQYSI